MCVHVRVCGVCGVCGVCVCVRACVRACVWCVRCVWCLHVCVCVCVHMCGYMMVIYRQSPRELDRVNSLLASAVKRSI